MGYLGHFLFKSGLCLTRKVYRGQGSNVFVLFCLVQLIISTKCAETTTPAEKQQTVNVANSSNMSDDVIEVKSLGSSGNLAEKTVLQRLNALDVTVAQLKSSRVPHVFDKQAEMLVKLETIEKEIDPKVLLEKLSKNLYWKTERLNNEIDLVRKGVVAKVFSWDEDNARKSLGKLRTLISEGLSAKDVVKIRQFEKEVQKLRSDIKSLKQTDDIDLIKTRIQTLSSEMNSFIPSKKVPIYDDFFKVLDNMSKAVSGYVDRFVKWSKEGKYDKQV